jgi:hypothetical protein
VYKRKRKLINKEQKKEIELKELLPLMEESLAAGRTVRFSPRGVSMLPMLRQGIDYVVLSPVNGKLHKYDIPFYRRDDGKFILHRIVKVGKTYTCIGDNQFKLEPGVRHDQVIAVVSAFSRGEREHKVSEWNYQIYCRFWHYTRSYRHFYRRAKGWLRRHFK